MPKRNPASVLLVSDAAADVGGPRAEHTGFGSVGAARAELHHARGQPRAAVMRAAFDAIQCLKRQRGEKVRFRNLRFHDRRFEITVRTGSPAKSMVRFRRRQPTHLP